MSKTMHKVCIYSIGVSMTALTVAFVLSRVLPPVSPAETAQAVAEYYRAHATQLQIGSVVGTLGGVFYAPFSAALAWEVRRMTRSDEAAYVQIILGVIATLGFVQPWTQFMAAAFRPDRPAQDLHVIYDSAWLPLYTVAAAVALQFVFLAWAMLKDGRVKPAFPRWFAHFTVFVGLMQLFGVFVVFTKTGPFAWNGAIAYWVPFVVFGVWSNLVVRYMMNSLKAEPEDEPEAFDGETSQLDERVEGLEAELAAFRSQFADAPRGV